MATDGNPTVRAAPGGPMGEAGGRLTAGAPAAATADVGAHRAGGGGGAVAEKHWERGGGGHGEGGGATVGARGVEVWGRRTGRGRHRQSSDGPNGKPTGVGADLCTYLHGEVSHETVAR